ncbi:uncharacterized protein LOC105888532 isoform X2 [Clupea harengus]|uniref:Uncharacterized protein LOC105888532 isoform X2 n=1 Tax=Clupea harengus TaxID=7950 RepID=A0A8M1KUG0_CLUHA|nr:uncharacterized protein LOC105888532 isoform X2 [Clupea harengus]
MAAEKDKLQKRMEITKYAVDVTLDPDTAHNHLILSADGKQVRTGDSSQNRPDNPKRFDPVVNVLGKQGFTSGRFYYEVEVSGKTAWDLGVARESINRKGQITVSPDNGYWTIWLRNGNEYMAHTSPSVLLSLKEKPERVGVFVDYGAGLVSFYDADRWNLIYSFRGVSFKEKTYPYFSPSLNDGGNNSSPLIIVTPISCPKSQLQDKFHTMAAERDKLQKRMEITKYAVDVTLDPDTAHNHLILSADGKQVRTGDSSQNRPDNPKRFDSTVCVLGEQGFTSGRFYYEVEVSGKTAWDLGVARESINRKGQITVSPDNGYWTIWLRNGDEYKAHTSPSVLLSLKEKPERVGVFVDYEAGLVSFYDADRWNLIYSFRGVSFKEKTYPYFSPSLNDGGNNSSPLIIVTPISCPKSQLQDKFHTMAAERDKLQKRMEITQYAVDVTLDPDTAENNLILSADGKQVRHVDTPQNLPDNPKRFDPVVNVLGKQGFTSGRFYYEVEVSGKTAWDLGVARESINRKGRITLSPENGHWTIWLRNGDEYEAHAGPSILLSLKEKPERVGVFVDYEAGLVSFYDADRWNLIYSFRGVSFKEKIFPFFTPCPNYGGKNSSPLIIITPITSPK